MSDAVTLTHSFADVFAPNPNIVGGIESTVFLTRVSPEVIFLRPPESLTIEIKASGRYSRLDLQINGGNVSMEQDFYSHREIYFVRETTMASRGLYEYQASPSPPDFNQQFLPAELDFFVVLPGKGQLFC